MILLLIYLRVSTWEKGGPNDGNRETCIHLYILGLQPVMRSPNGYIASKNDLQGWTAECAVRLITALLLFQSLSVVLIVFLICKLYCWIHFCSVSIVIQKLGSVIFVILFQYLDTCRYMFC